MMGITEKEIEQFFFKAMMEGWSTSKKKIKILKMPGYKAIPYKDGDFYLLDFYCTTPNSDRSAGTTTIWYKNLPVWTMNYGGYYEEHVIDFLKLALLKTVEKQEFIGGRGPRKFAHRNFNGLMYVNNPKIGSIGFREFKGREEIYDFLNGDYYGFHEYWGMLLI